MNNKIIAIILILNLSFAIAGNRHDDKGLVKELEQLKQSLQWIDVTGNTDHFDTECEYRYKIIKHSPANVNTNVDGFLGGYVYATYVLKEWLYNEMDIEQYQFHVKFTDKSQFDKSSHEKWRGTKIKTFKRCM